MEMSGQLRPRLDGPQSCSGSCGEEKNLSFAENRNPVVQSVAHRCLDWAIPTPHCVSIVHNKEILGEQTGEW
jgi:hypothetical protein